jgi:hypothetical protein
MNPGTPVNVIRQIVMTHIADRLNELKLTKKVSSPIIILHGIAGIGKSYAIRQLYERFATEYNVIWLGFDPAELRRLSLDDQRSIQPLADALKVLDQLPTLQGQIDPPNDPQIKVFCRSTLIEAEEPYTLLLLDALDDLPIWKWLQEEIIKQLCEQQRAVIVCTSQSPLFWDYWELRDWCEEYTFKEFDQPEIAAYLNQRGLTDFQHLLETVWDYSLGYPLAVSNLTDQIADSNVANSGAHVPIKRLDVLSNSDWQLLEYVGVMRLAEVEVMRTLLERAGNTQVSVMELTRLLKKLQLAGHLRLTRPELPKQMALELRQEVKDRIIQQAPDTYAHLCRHLEEIYYDLAINKPKTAVHACIEWLYFSSELLAEGHVDRKDWLSRLQDILKRASAVNTEVIKDVRTLDLNPADASLVVLFYRDHELIAQLQEFKIFKDVDSAMQGFLSDIQDTLQECRPDVERELRELTALPMRKDFERSCSTVLKSLGERLPVDLLPELMQKHENFTANIRFLIDPEEVDVAALRKQDSFPDAFLSQRQINDMLAIFNSRGLLSYDRTRRTYKFHPLIKHLVWIAGEWASPRASARDIDHVAP